MNFASGLCVFVFVRYICQDVMFMVLFLPLTILLYFGVVVSVVVVVSLFRVLFLVFWFLVFSCLSSSWSFILGHLHYRSGSGHDVGLSLVYGS